MSTLTPEQSKDIWNMIKDIKVGMLTTTCADTFHSRPMHNVQKEEDFTDKLYFFTAANSGKVEEIEENAQVCVTYADHGRETYVCFAGPVRITQDRSLIQKFWNPAMKAYFPEGENGPNVALLEIQIEHAEYWDSTSSRMVQFFEFLKANITGERPNLGEHRHVL